MATKSTKTSKTNTSKTKKTTAAKKVTTSAAKTKTMKTKAVKAAKPAIAVKKDVPKKVSLSLRSGNKTKKVAKQLTATMLVTWHKWLALLFAAQGAAVLFLGTSAFVPVSGNFLAEDTLASQGNEIVRVPAVEHMFDVNLAYLVAGICFVFALMSLLIATVYKASYEQALTRKVNRYRWTTFSFGLGTLTVLLGLMVGAQDVATLLMLFVLTVIVSLAGLGLEMLGTTQQQARSVISGLGTIAWLTLWAVLALYFVYAGIYEGSIPNYVYFVVGSALVLSVLLVSVLRRQQAGVGAWSDYLRAERAYLFVSFVLVSAVTWQVYVGALQP